MSNTVKASEAIRFENAQKYYSGYNTHVYKYKMNSTTYQKRIKENLKMNKNLIYTPAEERYWLRLRTANQDLSTAYNGHRVRDFDQTFSPKKYKAYRNNLPGFYGAPYDYVKYLPESGFDSNKLINNTEASDGKRTSNSQSKKTLNSDYGTLNNTEASDGKRTRNSQREKTLNSDYGTLNNTEASDGKRTRNSQREKTLNSDNGTRDEINKDKKNNRCFSSIASSDIPEIPSSSSSSSSSDSNSFNSKSKNKTAEIEEISKETKYFEIDENINIERQTGRETGKVLESTDTGDRSGYNS